MWLRPPNQIQTAIAWFVPVLTVTVVTKAKHQTAVAVPATVRTVAPANYRAAPFGERLIT